MTKRPQARTVATILSIVLGVALIGGAVFLGRALGGTPTVTSTSSPSVSRSPSLKASPSPSPSVESMPPSPEPEPSDTPMPPVADPLAAVAGLVIVLDPGHNGGNASHSSEINAQVPDGRGGMKACNTTGTATSGGYAEHTFTWQVANKTKDVLTAAGATVLMTRDSDTGVGPCVDVRGQYPQQHGADLMVSIHGDGSTNTALHGFFALVSSPALNNAQGPPSEALAHSVIDALVAQGFQTNSAFSGGMQYRDDIAGLNWSERPTVLMELGEMKNPQDAAMMASADGQSRLAQGIATGIAQWAQKR